MESDIVTANGMLLKSIVKFIKESDDYMVNALSYGMFCIGYEDFNLNMDKSKIIDLIANIGDDDNDRYTLYTMISGIIIGIKSYIISVNKMVESNN